MTFDAHWPTALRSGRGNDLKLSVGGVTIDHAENAGPLRPPRALIWAGPLRDSVNNERMPVCNQLARSGQQQSSCF